MAIYTAGIRFAKDLYYSFKLTLSDAANTLNFHLENGEDTIEDEIDLDDIEGS